MNTPTRRPFDARPPSGRRRRDADPARGLPAAGALAAALALGWLSTCAPNPQVPEEVPPPPAPFERVPYLQALDGDSAVVRWRSDPADEGGLEYRIGSGPWRTPAVETLSGGDRRVILDSLPPAEPVTYRVRAGGTELGPFAFRAPPPDTAPVTLRVLAFGDSGWGGPAQLALARHMAEREWDLALHVGDVAYPDGSEADFTLRHFDVYGDLFAGAPFFPVPGNHDLHAEDGAAYDRAFDWPDGREGGRFYTFRWGGVRFVALDTSADAVRDSLGDRTGSQHGWLVDVLETSARDTTLEWTVVYSHYPIYSHAAGIAGHGPDEELREALEPLFVEHGVDLVLAGHDHHYERTVPIRDARNVDPGCGPVYMVTGGGGAQRFARSVSPDVHTARVDRSHHFLSLRIQPDVVVGEAVGREGRAIDSFRVRPTAPAGRDPACG